MPEDALNTDTSEAIFGEGNSAEKSYGVLYQGDYQHPADGTSVAIRLHARALASAGIPVLLKPFTSNVITKDGVVEPLHVVGLNEKVKAEVDHLTQASISKLFPAIRHFVIHKPEDVSNRVMRGSVGPLDEPEIIMKARRAMYQSTILYSVWERDRIDSKIAREMERVQQNWVPSNQNANMLEEMGLQNVHVVPHPYDPDDPVCTLIQREPRQYRLVDLSEKRFYSIGRWEPRKNQAMLIRAFLSAFRPGDRVHLTLKWHGKWKDYPSFEEIVPNLIQEAPGWDKESFDKHVTTFSGFMRRDQIVRLHFENNIYVAPSCGEAWCLPAFEAKLAGNRVIATDWGGVSDFAEMGDLLLPYQYEEVPKSYGWEQDARWASPLFHTLVRSMQEDVPVLFKHPTKAKTLQQVGEIMAERIIQGIQDSPSRSYFQECLQRA